MDLKILPVRYNVYLDERCIGLLTRTPRSWIFYCKPDNSYHDGSTPELAITRSSWVMQRITQQSGPDGPLAHCIFPVLPD